MHRSRFALFAGFCLSLCLAVYHAVGEVFDRSVKFATEFFHLDHVDHRVSLDLDRAALDAKTPTMLQRAKAFASRAFEHDRFSAGRFDLARSTVA